MKIVAAGATGFIGRALLNHLVEAHHVVTLLTRNPIAAKSLAGRSVGIETWDGQTAGPWVRYVDGADAVINLAGGSIGAMRWTNARKALILDSRVNATKAIVAAIRRARKKPTVLVNASAVGYYGNVESGDVTESHPRGNDFLADVCARWEHEAIAAEALGVRVVIPRNGVVLERDGGALQRLLLPFTFFIGGPLGSGRQWFPWIHRNDVIDAVLFALEHRKISGPVNLTAPEPVTMKEFCNALGKALGRPSWAPVPALMLRIALGEMSQMILTGQRVIPNKLQEAGYIFKYPKLDRALAAILKK